MGHKYIVVRFSRNYYYERLIIDPWSVIKDMLEGIRQSYSIDDIEVYDSWKEMREAEYEYAEYLHKTPVMPKVIDNEVARLFIGKKHNINPEELYFVGDN